jgi:hypothetical protein
LIHTYPVQPLRQRGMELRDALRNLKHALPGLDPGIPVLEPEIGKAQNGVDGRDKPGKGGL